MKEEIKKLLTKYKSQTMDDKDLKILEQYIANGKLDLSDFPELLQTSSDLEKIIQVEPPKSMDRKFYTMLGRETEKLRRRDWLKEWFGRLPLTVQYAMPFLLILLGILIGWQSTQSPYTIKDETSLLVSTVLHGSSTSDRISAVNNTYVKKPGEIEAIINVLVFSLNNDKSNNVRIAAIEALLKYGNRPEVREGLIDAIRHQTSPIVLMNLAQGLKLIGNEIPIDRYKDMLHEDLPPDAIKQIEEGLKFI
jgi:hypothetical protein